MSSWIPVSERYPEENTPVWGAAVGQGPMLASVHWDEGGWLWSQVNAHWWSPKDGWQCDAECDDDYGWITHWMPLPAPPEEDIEPDITKCPTCGGEADNGFDRCLPPSPYLCSKCDSNATPSPK